MSQPGLGIVFDTVAEVFPNCRVFRDNPASGSGPGPGPGPRSGAEAEAESKSKSKGVAKSRASKSDFLNMVFFCRKRGNGRRIAFRAPVEEDFLGTASRRAYLLPRPDLELPFPRTLPGSGRAQRSEGRREDGTADETDSAGETAAPHRRVLGRDAAVMKELQGHHATAALEHWRLMRGLLKDVVWEMW